MLAYADVCDTYRSGRFGTFPQGIQARGRRRGGTKFTTSFTGTKDVRSLLALLVLFLEESKHVAVAEEVRSFSTSVNGTKVQVLTAGARRTGGANEARSRYDSICTFVPQKLVLKFRTSCACRRGEQHAIKILFLFYLFFLFNSFLFAYRRGERSATKMLLRRIKPPCSNGECPVFSWLLCHV
jgi:hypothetical protein